jgi:hypothetical protein
MAYTVGRKKDGSPEVTPRAFLVGQVTLAPTDEPHSWPPLCQWNWSWSDPLGHFVLNGMTPMPCILRGTAYLQAALIPRTDIPIRVNVTVEGEEERVVIPARVILDQRSQEDWSGTPIVMATINASDLSDGFQRIRLAGGYREYEIDGDPATPGFEPGGDANTAFIVQNHPARLMALAVLDDTTTVYSAAWLAEGPSRARKLVLHRERRGQTGAGSAPAVTMKFSVPIAGCQVTFRRDADTWFTVPGAPANGEDTWSTSWKAQGKPGDLKEGRWRIEVDARDLEGNPLEPLEGTSVPLSRLGSLDSTGGCRVQGKPCRRGPDRGHGITVAR